MLTYHLGTGITVAGTIVPSRVIDRIYDRARLLGEFGPQDVKTIALDELTRHGMSRSIYDRTGEDLMSRWKYRSLIAKTSQKGRWVWVD